MVSYNCYSGPWGRGESKETPVRELPIKRKVGNAQGFKKEGCSAEECKFFRIT